MEPTPTPTPPPGPSSTMRWVGGIILVLGLALLLVGIAYATIENQNLPSFLGPIKGQPGHMHRTKRAAAGIVGGGVILVAGAILYVRGGKARPKAGSAPNGESV